MRPFQLVPQRDDKSDTLGQATFDTLAQATFDIPVQACPLNQSDFSSEDPTHQAPPRVTTESR